MPKLTHSSVLALEANSMDVAIHQHSAYQIVLTIEHPFTCSLEGATFEDIKGFIIAPQVAHQCSNIKGKVLVINIEADSAFGKTLDNFYLTDHPIQVIRNPSEIFPSPFPSKGSSSETILHGILQELDNKPADHQLDPRVVEIAAYIRSNIDRKIKPAELAEKVYISPSRLLAIFKKETGSSLSKFLLWTRLRTAIEKILKENKAITEAALESGFYDPPSFNRYMYQMIGVPPIALKQNSNIIQLIK